MNKQEYRKHMNNLGLYLEHVILPELIAFGIADMYYHNIDINKSYKYFFNFYKRYVNVRFINYRIVLTIVKNILKNKYHLLIVEYYPLIVIKNEFNNH